MMPEALAALHRNVLSRSLVGRRPLRDLLAAPRHVCVSFAGRLHPGAGRRRRSGNPHPGGGAAARGRGLGRALLRAAARHAQTLGAANLFLEVGVDNPAALALYAGQGFVRVGQRKAYYDGRDALILKAQLPLPKSGDIRLTFDAERAKGE